MKLPLWAVLYVAVNGLAIAAVTVIAKSTPVFI